jgi:protein-L-isoaspartate(D-aspartate) O-methyltransferase
VLRALGYDNVEVRVGDGSKGAPDRSPFGGISVTAAAREEPPPALIEQLAADGHLVAPVRQGGEERLMRFGGGRKQAFVPVRFVPLVTD